MAPLFLLGLIGSGIQGSLSPAMHQREAEEQGVPCIYKLIDLDQHGYSLDALPQLLRTAEWMGFTGLNITVPCKQEVMPLLDELSDDAKALGAVNTVLLHNGRRVGHNTDLFGFAESFRRGLPDVERERVVQLGAGGAGAAVAHAALSLGTGQLILFDADSARAEQLAANLSSHFGKGRAVAGAELCTAVASADGLVNATPVGMAKLPGVPVPLALLRPTLWVVEIIYFPIKTELLRAAQFLGCRTLDGGSMAVFQAAEAFRLFTGLAPDAERMLRHFAALQAAAPTG